MVRRFLHLPLFALLAISLVFATPGLSSQEQITNKGVKKRVALMLTSQAAIATLSDMMAGRVAFQADKARAARRSLIRTNSSIARRFKKSHQDPLSNARPEIWTYWSDFKIQADLAEDAARQLNANNIGGLRRTLPNMLQSCLSCHDSYRTEPNEFITH